MATRFFGRFFGPPLLALFASVAGPATLYTARLAGTPTQLLVMVLLFGAALGSSFGRLRPQASVASIALASQAGLLLCWVPIVLATSGIALRATPWLLLYGVAVAAGVLVGRRIGPPKAPGPDGG